MPRKKQASDDQLDLTPTNSLPLVDADEDKKVSKRSRSGDDDASPFLRLLERDPGKVKALETTLATLKKRFGDGTIMKLGEAPQLKVEAIPTGSLAVDLAVGVG